MMMDHLREYYPQQALFSVFAIARSTYKYARQGVNQTDNDKELKQQVVEIYTSSRSSAGSHTVSGMLKQRGESVGHYKARRLMQSLGLVSRQARKHRYCLAESESVIAPNYLARGFTVTQPNRVAAWCVVIV